MLNNSLYKIERNLLLVAFALTGFGHHFMGISLPMEYSTFLIFAVLFIQIISGTFKFSKFLFYVLAFIILQTFIINPSNLSEPKVISHYIGLTLVSAAIFSFVSNYRDKLYNFVTSYYKLVYYIALFSIFQIGIFLLTGLSIIPQNLITGTTIAMGSNNFVPQFLGILPRNIGLSTEPSNFAYILIPAVHIGLYQILIRKPLIKLPKHYAWVILISMALTFSLVAYFGIVVSAILILRKVFLKNFKGFVYAGIVSFILAFGIFSSGIGDKLTNLFTLGAEVSAGSYKSHNLTSFAMISNLGVAIKSQKKNNFIGSGLNTHSKSYDKFIYSIINRKDVIMELNREDGSSLFIRIFSEFGIPGLFALLYFLFHFRLKGRGGKQNYIRINEIALVTLIVVCTRNGSYVGIQLLMFAAIYFFSYRIYTISPNHTLSTQAINIK